MMKRNFAGLLILLSIVFLECPAFCQDPLRFSKEIEAYKTSDQTHPPSKGCVLFVGSSSIRFWKTLSEDFPGYCVLNRGFGGSEISDVNYFFNDIVAPYKPQMVFLYAGDNDLADHKKPKTILKDFKKFLTKMDSVSPGVPVIYIAAKPSPSRWALKDSYEKFNSMVSKYCQSKENIFFSDIFYPMLGENGRPVPALYVEDSLHMTHKGYEIWTKKLTPFLEKYYDPDKVEMNNH